ncbi:MAG: FAD-dependent oxidoreductase [Armatimonadaceae bacterium]
MILGGGSAGIVAGNVAGAVGARVALVEKSRIGGECLWTGCVPSKALLHASDMAQMIREAKNIGFKNLRSLRREDCSAAWDYVRQKIEETRVNDASEQMLKDSGVELFFGGGEFLGPHLVRSPEGDLQGASFLIATGSSPRVPSIPGLEDAGYLTNVSLFDLTETPESVVILGGGPIACEMGQALSRLGAEVTLLQRDERLLSKDDPENVAILTECLRAEGLEIVLGAEVISAARRDEQKTVTARLSDGTEKTFAAAEILVATGRVPNSGHLGLDRVGVARDKRGYIQTEPNGRTSVPHIWACGDVIGEAQFSHMAEHEAKKVVRNILLPGSEEIPLNLVPWTTFTDPEVARVGLTEDEARKKHGDETIRILKHSFKQDDRAIVDNKTAGQVKLIVHKVTGEVYGAHIVGPRAGELIQEWIIAIQQRLPVRVLADMIHVYPALTVTNQRAAQKWYVGITEQPLVKGALNLLGYSPHEPEIS